MKVFISESIVRKRWSILDWVAQLFQAIDRMDSDGLALFLANDATFQFGNAQPVKGKQNVRDAVAGSSQASGESATGF